MNLDKKVKDRKIGRECAADVLFILREQLLHIGDNSDSLDAFWDTIYRAFPDEIAKPTPPKVFKPMTEEEAKRFDDVQMPFGKFKNMKMKEIDLGYLSWFAEQPDELKHNVQRYLASRRIQREMQ